MVKNPFKKDPDEIVGVIVNCEFTFNLSINAIKNFIIPRIEEYLNLGTNDTDDPFKKQDIVWNLSDKSTDKLHVLELQYILEEFKNKEDKIYSESFSKTLDAFFKKRFSIDVLGLEMENLTIKPLTHDGEQLMIREWATGDESKNESKPSTDIPIPTDSKKNDSLEEETTSQSKSFSQDKNQQDSEEES